MPADTDSGNPAPLGLVGFGLTTVLLSSVNAGVFGSAAVALPLGLAFGGTIQFVAGVFEYREGNTFGMTAFCSYGAFWWWFALLEIFAANDILSVGGSTVGFALLLWALFTLYMWISTFKLNWALWSVFLTLWITFALLGLGELGYGTSALGGWIGMLCGLLAMYTSFAEVTNWAWDRVVVPVGSAPLGDD
ncbi:transcriptional regulator [Halarchaeum acidiphilum MH1-52-1]|uniref:Transcriptional regulator n=1 Tax=Halarchaeum acidiphilum MH1-52-1 TaxID=1261545 RepID=U2YFJ9_9EURY|nr:GPR1/FUN34/YaaH family transporter [Halarchaeum acidiphilum]GAD52811.1 transcriptional regulator [Halarchaeum acidiphilum MH1-52-1]